MPGPPSSFFKPPPGPPKKAPRATLLRQLARNWWALLLRGVFAVVFGLLAFAWPGLTLVTLILFYGAYAAVDGGFALVAAILGGTRVPRWWLCLAGLLSLAAAAMTLLYPGVTVFVLLAFIGVWAIARGVMEIVGAIQLRKEIEGEWFLVVGGFLSILFGVFVLISPGAGAIALLWLIASYAMALGIVFIGLALRLRRYHLKPGA